MVVRPLLVPALVPDSLNQVFQVARQFAGFAVAEVAVGQVAAFLVIDVLKFIQQPGCLAGSERSLRDAIGYARPGFALQVADAGGFPAVVSRQTGGVGTLVEGTVRTGWALAVATVISVTLGKCARG